MFGGLQYIAGIRAAIIRCLVVLLHLLLSGLNIQFQFLPGSVGYGDRILGEGNNSEGESALACTEVLYATLYRMMPRNVAEQYCLISRASRIHWTTRWVCSIVESLSLKPNW
jgi:hypothetical protein